MQCLMKRYLSLGACFMFLFGLSQCVVGVELSPLKEGEALKADFSQFRSLSTLPKPMTSTGQLVLWQGKGILWETKTPFPNMILINKNGLLYHLHSHTIMWKYLFSTHLRQQKAVGMA